ncbi:hypothetical protein BLNAU_6412 [Blattamonas nauphoetae]|uniref:Uncharacterized protein n=1 Tax=Blattamonas nauphoetae TaxID=2049346 RepID=A0ABQ9Y4M1_9EUKA|nr:hypothetical protein BLNAU_6412 [Blattamonas nauphoetae]
MTFHASRFNIEGGLLGLGADVLLEVVHEMTSIRDLQTFIGLCQTTFHLSTHPRFGWAVATAITDTTGTKAIILRELKSVRYLLSSINKPGMGNTIRTAVFDITQDRETQLAASQTILSLTILQKNLTLRPQKSFIASCLVYIDGLNRLHKKNISFNEDFDEHHQERTTQWIKSIALPPITERFVSIKSQGSIAFALSLSGEIWVRGMDIDGTYTESEEWIVPPFFSTADGRLDSSRGRSAVRYFTLDTLNSFVFLHNGAVFAVGNLKMFKQYESSIPNFGFIELTSPTLVPIAEPSLTGALNTDAGEFGIFGVHKPVHYFRRMSCFLTSDGVVFARVSSDPEKEGYIFSPIDNALFFNGEGIHDMCYHDCHAYVTTGGRIVVVKGRRRVTTMADDLAHPLFVHPLPYSVTRLKRVLFVDEESVTIMKDDGTVQYLCKGTPIAKDVSDELRVMTFSDVYPFGMVTKKFSQSGTHYFFLLE